MEQVPAPSMRGEQIVVMDNFSLHEAQRMEEPDERGSCELPAALLAGP